MKCISSSPTPPFCRQRKPLKILSTETLLLLRRSAHLTPLGGVRKIICPYSQHTQIIYTHTHTNNNARTHARTHDTAFTTNIGTHTTPLHPPPRQRQTDRQADIFGEAVGGGVKIGLRNLRYPYYSPSLQYGGILFIISILCYTQGMFLIDRTP